MDLGVWLRSLGLEQYEAAFRRNAIDDPVRPSLTAEDLKELGVGAVGTRRKLLNAIAALRADAGVKATSPGSFSAIDESAKDTAERRQVTVMFSDLVGSAALSAGMDPEDLREVISAYQKCVADTVHRFDGFVARYMGDGVLVYFGYPFAHEDDAERAVQAGLETIAAVSSLNTRAALQTRVGIATGVVVVGDLIGSGDTQERSIVGKTPDLAARLQGIAEPDTVVICDSTRRLLGNLFELKDLGPRNDLKGVGQAVRAWAVLRASSVASRFEALHASGMTALVGREEEFELLRRRWERAKNGEGQVVLLSGEAGIGKPRLTAALLESVAAEPHTRLRYFCSPQRRDSALYPIIGQMERAAGLTHEDSPQTRLDRLDALLAQTSASALDAALFVEMLSLANDGRYPTIELTPQQRRQRTLDALTTQMEALTRASPVLMIFEDVQWIDPTSLEAIGRAVDQIRTLRVLLILTFRPEFNPPWIGSPHVTALTINRLGPDDIEAMIGGLVGDMLLPANIRQDIIERTDGIPLFVEEMTKAVLEAGEPVVAAVPAPALAVPASLPAALMARLDRLGPAKELAQIGAAIGREFSHALLAAVVRKPDGDLETALDRLISAGLLFRQGVPPHATYLFKHALVQDAAYGTLLREQRRALHARVAEALESQFPEIAESHPELLAHHCAEAGLIEKAAGLWGEAGQRSLARSALVEAVEQLSRALGQIATLPSTAELRREEIRLQVALINPLFHVKGYAAPETKSAIERARFLIERAEALGEPSEDPLLLFSVLYGSWVANFIAFNGDVMRELATRFLELAEKQGAPVPRMIGHRLMGTSLTATGDIAEAQAHHDQAIALYDPARHRPLVTRFGQDAGVSALSFRSLSLWFLGYPDAALADADHALEVAREIGQAATLMFALAITNFTRIFCRSAASERIDELIALADEKGASQRKAEGVIQKGCVLALIGEAPGAVQMITSGATAWQATGARVWVPLYLSHLAMAYAEVGQINDARRCIGEAMTAMEATKERWYEAEVYRMTGEIALKSPECVTKAEAYFQHALAIARAQQAKSWELRAAMSMARLWRDQGKRNEARDLLTPVYNSFTEGFDTLDLKEAKALLETLPT